MSASEFPPLELGHCICDWPGKKVCAQLFIREVQILVKILNNPFAGSRFLKFPFEIIYFLHTVPYVNKTSLDNYSLDLNSTFIKNLDGYVHSYIENVHAIL